MENKLSAFSPSLFLVVKLALNCSWYGAGRYLALMSDNNSPRCSRSHKQEPKLMRYPHRKLFECKKKFHYAYCRNILIMTGNRAQEE